MKTLSGLDASFLYLECAEMPMHVGSLHVYELPEGFSGSFHQAVQVHVAARLHLVPLFNQQLAPMPLNVGHPSWVRRRWTHPLPGSGCVGRLAASGRTCPRRRARLRRARGRGLHRRTGTTRSWLLPRRRKRRRAPVSTCP